MSTYSSENGSFSNYKPNNDHICSLCNDKFGSVSNTARQCNKCQRKICKHCYNSQSKQCVNCIDSFQSNIERQKIEEALKRSQDQLKKLEQELNIQLQASNAAEAKRNKYKKKLDDYIQEQNKIKSQQEAEASEAKQEYGKLLSQNEALSLNIKNVHQKLSELQVQSENLDKDNMELQEKNNSLKTQIQTMHIRMNQEIAKTNSMQAELNNFRTQSLASSRKVSKQKSLIEDEKKIESSNKSSKQCLIY